MFQEDRGLVLIQQMELKMHSYTRHAMIDLYSKLESKVAYIMGHTQPNIPAYVTRVLSGKQKMNNCVVQKREKGEKQGELYQILTAKRAFSPIPVLFCSLFSFFFLFFVTLEQDLFGS